MPTFSDQVTAGSTFQADGATTLNGATTVNGQLITNGAIDLSASTLSLPAGSVEPAEESSGYRTVASDDPLTLAATDRTILLLASAVGTKTATMTATHAGHKIDLRLVARTGGQYDLPVSGGTITLDAANEGCSIVFDGAAWQLQHLAGATFA